MQAYWVPDLTAEHRIVEDGKDAWGRTKYKKGISLKLCCF